MSERYNENIPEMEFHEQWINWVLETADEQAISKIGRECFKNSDWVKNFPIYSKDKSQRKGSENHFKRG
ncbi:MAG: hypothetical protein U9N62_07420 [Thermotogota bacterium]|nr:hypothetical protein [Thermotogota bacterium]